MSLCYVLLSANKLEVVSNLHPYAGMDIISVMNHVTISPGSWGHEVTTALILRQASMVQCVDSDSITN